MSISRKERTSEHRNTLIFRSQKDKEESAKEIDHCHPQTKSESWKFESRNLERYSDIQIHEAYRPSDRFHSKKSSPNTL